MAAPFDAERLVLTGAPVPVVPGAGSSAWSADGTLLYTPGTGGRIGEGDRALVWLDRAGNEEPIPAPPRVYGTPRLSPTGDRIALDIAADDGTSDIFVYDLAREASNRLTFEGWNVNPLWSQDGGGILFTSLRSDGFNLSRKAANGTGQVEGLGTTRPIQMASAWAGEPGTLVVMRANSMTDVDIHLLRLDGDRGAEPLIATSFSESLPAVSPDGRWIAYQSNESGRSAIYVRPFPNIDDGKWQVSPGVGFSPVWSRDGRELFYIAAGPDGRVMMAVGYAGEPTFTPARPERLFTLPDHIDFGGAFRQWDVAPDGERFVMLRETEEDPAGNDPRLTRAWGRRSSPTSATGSRSSSSASRFPEPTARRALAVADEIVDAFAGLVAGWGVVGEGGDDGADAAGIEFVPSLFRPLRGEFGPGCVDGLGDVPEVAFGRFRLRRARRCGTNFFSRDWRPSRSVCARARVPFGAKEISMNLQRTLVALFVLGMVAAAAPGYAQHDAEVTYYKDVLPIMQENCQTCHRQSGYNISGLIAPMSFMDYRETRPWARSIASGARSSRESPHFPDEMPPWFASAPKGVFDNERGLTDAEIHTILQWVEAGAPAGDRADAPPAVRCSGRRTPTTAGR